jgi:hypothetical protein
MQSVHLCLTLAATVDDTVQNINHLVSIHNKAIDHLALLFAKEDMHDVYMLPSLKPRPFAGRTITSADLYLLHTEWLSQIKFQIPKVEVPSSAQGMLCYTPKCVPKGSNLMTNPSDGCCQQTCVISFPLSVAVHSM